MGRYFNCSIADVSGSVPILKVSLGEPATNAEIVPDAVESIAALHLPGGRGIHIDGAITVPTAMAVAHAVAHLYGYVACYDPKIESYVVVISHDPDFHVGQLLERKDPDRPLPQS
ncbi:MAG: CRISPR-associated protein Csx3 [Terriglobia bacterium]